MGFQNVSIKLRLYHFFVFKNKNTQRKFTLCKVIKCSKICV